MQAHEATDAANRSKSKVVSWSRATTREQMKVIARHAIDVNLKELTREQRTPVILDGMNLEDTMTSDFMTHKAANLNRPPCGYYVLKRRDWDPTNGFHNLPDRKEAAQLTVGVSSFL